MPKNPRKKRSLDEIHDLIGELNRSKLTVSQFANREGVSVGAIYQWKRKVQEVTSETANAQVPAPVEVIAPPQLWSESQMPLVKDSGVNLTLPGGISCRVQPGFHSETLVQVIQLLNKAAL